MSGSGKTTIALALHDRLESARRPSGVLDGDELRRTISSDLGFTKEDRDTHVGRVAKLALHMARNGQIAIVALISPYRSAREQARELILSEYPFMEVHVDCPLDVLRARDPKGLYRKAAAGEVGQFTGVSDPYEPPTAPELRIDSSRTSVEDAVDHILTVLDKPPS